MDNLGYICFDIMVVGKEFFEFILCCQKVIVEEKKVLFGFWFSNFFVDVFMLIKGEYVGEVCFSFKVWLIKVNWIKIGFEMVYKEEKLELSVFFVLDVFFLKQFGDNQF